MEQKLYTVKERIDYYRVEIVELSKRLAYCTKRLGALLEEEAKDMAKQAREAALNERKGGS